MKDDIRWWACTHPVFIGGETGLLSYDRGRKRAIGQGQKP
jgi:hypothetical protein